MTTLRHSLPGLDAYLRRHVPAQARILAALATGVANQAASSRWPALRRIEVDGQALDLTADRITPAGPLLEAYSYMVQLTPAGKEQRQVGC